MGSLVNCRGSPPSIGKQPDLGGAPRLETNAMDLPSGLQRGWLLVPGAVVSCFGSPPARGHEPETAVGLVGRPVEFGNDIDD